MNTNPAFDFLRSAQAEKQARAALRSGAQHVHIYSSQSPETAAVVADKLDGWHVIWDLLTPEARFDMRQEGAQIVTSGAARHPGAANVHLVTC